MKNDIEEDYCSFEVSKLLKEKGFDCLCRIYMQEGKEEKYETWGRNSMITSRIYIPTHNVALKWLLQNFDVTIEASYDFITWDVNIYGDGFEHKIISVLSNPDRPCFTEKEDAIEAGLLYVLNRLK